MCSICVGILSTPYPNPMASLSDKPRPYLLIADDHAVFLETLKCFLEKTYTVTGTVADGRSLVSEALRLKPDVLIVDIGMPLLNGFDAARRIREELPNVRLVFLTMKEGPQPGGRCAGVGPVSFRAQTLRSCRATDRD